MITPGGGGRTKGAEDLLWALRYSKIAEWTGLEVSTLRYYASQGEFDSRDIESVLKWVNQRRAAQGVPLIGLPEDRDPQT